MPTVDAPRKMLEPGAVLHELVRLGIRFRVSKGAFVTDACLALCELDKYALPGLKYAIEHQSDQLAELAATWTPQKCHWCHMAIAHGDRFIRVYSADEGRRFVFHAACHAERAEKLPNLPMPDIYLDEPGYTVLFEDYGVCCYCQRAEAIHPKEAPNVCNRCFKIRDAKKAIRDADGAEPGSMAGAQANATPMD